MQCARPEKPDKDINDVFDELLFCEEQSIELGYKEGYQKGLSEGNVEAYHLGYHRGAELGSELGFYFSVVTAQLSLKEDSKFSGNIVKQLITLKDLIETFPRCNDENVDIIKLADDIRIMYRKVCVMMKIDAQYPETDKLSF